MTVSTFSTSCADPTMVKQHAAVRRGATKGLGGACGQRGRRVGAHTGRHTDDNLLLRGGGAACCTFSSTSHCASSVRRDRRFPFAPHNLPDTGTAPDHRKVATLQACAHRAGRRPCCSTHQQACHVRNSLALRGRGGVGLLCAQNAAPATAPAPTPSMQGSCRSRHATRAPSQPHGRSGQPPPTHTALPTCNMCGCVCERRAQHGGNRARGLHMHPPCTTFPPMPITGA